MNADDSAKLRDLLANNRTLLAYIRTALAFAGLGFAVAKFGLNPKMMHVSGYLGTFMVLVGLLVTIIGFAQHRAVLIEVDPPPSAPALSRSSHIAAAIGCALACAVLAIYLATAGHRSPGHGRRCAAGNLTADQDPHTTCGTQVTPASQRFSP